MTNDAQTPVIVIVSNRGPYSFRQQEDGTFDVRRGAGGLVTALSEVARQHDLVWVSAALSDDDRAWAAAQGGKLVNIDGIQTGMVIPDRQAYEQYYNVIANPLLWFIQHQLWDAVRQPVITQATWDAWANGYVAMNQQFADAVVAMVADETRPLLIFPQDYHLYLMPAMLRAQLGDRAVLQPFVHIPWPGPDAWRMLSAEMREALLVGLLGSDRIGFQTKADAFNFVQTCRFYLRDAHSYGSRDSVTFEGRRVEARAYPISVDVGAVQAVAKSTEAQLFRTQIANIAGGRALILRTDRVEPSKNILRGLQAFRELLATYPEHHGRVVMLALLVPSRMEVPEYQTYLQEVMAEAGLINADYSDGLWEPVRIIVGNSYARAVAAMQLYDVLVVNPIADGMNLVAKEGVLVNERQGVLVLSELAGAAYELGEQALTISPFDVYATARAMHTGLTMPPMERAERATALREVVMQADVRAWFAAQVSDAVRDWTSHSNNSATPATSSTNKSAA